MPSNMPSTKRRPFCLSPKCWAQEPELRSEEGPPSVSILWSRTNIITVQSWRQLMQILYCWVQDGKADSIISQQSFLIGMSQWFVYDYEIDGLVQDCSDSSALALELLQSCTKPLI